MGRVRRYKKFKACDPFSKRKKTEVDTVHDEPPDIFEEKVIRDIKRKENIWDDEKKKELFLQREAIQFLKQEQDKKKQHEKKIEGKREDETMKEFKQRIRQETRLTLREELKGMTSTAKKRKEKLRERTAKKKLKAKLKATGGDVVQEEVVDFSMSADGRLRPSDLGATSSFAREEEVRFGERVERPPDLNHFAKLLVKKKRQPESQHSLGGGEGGGQKEEMVAKGGGGDEDDEESGGDAENDVEVKKKRRKTKVSDDVLDVDEVYSGTKGLGATGGKGGGGGTGVGGGRAVGGSAGIVFAGAGGSRATEAEMEAMRQRVQAAYRDLRARRQAAKR